MLFWCVQCSCDNVKTWVRAIQYVIEYKPVMATVSGKQFALPPSPELGQVEPAVVDLYHASLC